MDKRQIANAKQFFRKDDYIFSCAFPLAKNENSTVLGREVYMKNMKIINEDGK